ncbi:hypothetical protein MRX96_044250 [Rhipicephalus microplus]
MLNGACINELDRVRSLTLEVYTKLTTNERPKTKRSEHCEELLRCPTEMRNGPSGADSLWGPQMRPFQVSEHITVIGQGRAVEGNSSLRQRHPSCWKMAPPRLRFAFLLAHEFQFSSATAAVSVHGHVE